MPDLFIGCSGFTYPHWRGGFYPEKLPQARWFEYYCSIFTSVELNVTFYRLLKPSVFEHWRLKSPQGFSFSVKGSRFITHVKRLMDPEGPLERFFDGVLGLGGKLGVVLWQFPPGFGRETARLEHFLTALARYPVRNALEFRDESWCTEETYGLCRAAGAALCMADWPSFINDLPVTAPFVYIRRHGRGGSYATRYSIDELERDALRIRKYLETGLDVRIYFNNDAYAHAPENARELAGILGEGRDKLPLPER
ncbi:MAG TPA: DUF72 domain-containing protein [Geobacteraceae bacterium]|nr:DUF72 domain-containing protein [Geobacteraceae bacterium]